MASPLEDYALLSDLHTGALVSRTGSLDWLCFPRFDSQSVFASLLGNANHGRWLLAPADAPVWAAEDQADTEPRPPHNDGGSLAAAAPVLGGDVSQAEGSTQRRGDAVVIDRRYTDSTFVLRTHWKTDTGEALVTEFMPVGDRRASLVRRVEGLSGSVTMRQEVRVRFGYGTVVPWVSRVEDHDGEAIVGIAGPEAMVLRGDVLPKAAHRRHDGEFTVKAGEKVDLEIAWFPSHRRVPAAIDVDEALAETTNYWTRWSESCLRQGKYEEIVKRSLLVLRALTHESTGGIVAAPTTSLPEAFGGERNWDYRFCWLRDAALTLEAMLTHGFQQEALHWRNWLLRAVAGDPEDLQIMYGVAGERFLPERTLTHFPGYADSYPVRIGNGAVRQYQGDVVGEVMVALEKLRNRGGHEDHFSWPLQRNMLHFVENNLDRKDHGIWEMRGEKKHFTHSRVMMWAAMDRGVRAVRDHGLDGPVERWEKLRDQLRAEIMEHGFNKEINSFTQTYEGTEVDASLLVLPQVGFVDYRDECMLGTVARLERDLLDENGLLLRYRTESGLDGLEPGEHPFLACSFWLAEQYAHTGRMADAEKLMDQLVGYANELGLLSEEYDTVNQRMVGNFPQAFSHLALVRAADALHGVNQPAV
jgi:GH15 family glucan-1,4-alpha-glucosidase